MKRVLALLIASLACTCLSADEPGKWTKAGPPAPINAWCVQVWRCGPATDIIRDGDKQLIVTESQSTKGTCSAGDGVVDSCNVCLAPEPTATCSWRVE